MAVDPIYKFGGLKEALKQRGYRIGEAQAWRPITGTDIVLNDFRTDKVSFPNNGGIEYKDDEGYKHIGFLYKREYRLDEHGKPRMHLCRCRTLQEFIDRGSFAAEYRFAETSSVMVIDKDDAYKDKEVSNLPLCQNCIRLLYFSDYSSVHNSADFERLVQRTQEYASTTQAVKESEKDIFGYVKNWEQISREYRESHEFRCEKCGIQLTNPFDQRFIQVHHKNGKKADNRPSNLQCLCIKCHANIDENHRGRFGRGGNKRDLDDFINRYGKEVDENIQALRNIVLDDDEEFNTGA